MPQIQYDATGLSDGNKESLQEAGMAVAGVQWVNVNVAKDNIVVTHDDSFDEGAFASAIQSADGGVSLTKK